MSQNNESHPSEELLIEHALHGACPEVGQHIEECTLCAEFVDDMRSVKDGLASVQEEDVPTSVQERILAVSKRRPAASLVIRMLEDWYRNPFLIGMGTALLSIFLYLLYLFLV